MSDIKKLVCSFFNKLRLKLSNIKKSICSFFNKLRLTWSDFKENNTVGFSLIVVSIILLIFINYSFAITINTNNDLKDIIHTIITGIIYVFINILIRNNSEANADANINKRMCDMNDLFLITYTMVIFSTHFIDLENNSNFLCAILCSTLIIIGMFLLYFLLLYILTILSPKNSHWKN